MHIIERAETADAELRDVGLPVLYDVEASEHVSREVEACQVVEQHIIVRRWRTALWQVEQIHSRGIRHEENEGNVSVGRESAVSTCRRIVGRRLSRASVPKAGYVKASAANAAPSLQAFDDHASHLCDIALRIFLYQVSQLRTYGVGVGHTESRQGMHEYELRAVQTFREGGRSIFIQLFHTFAVALSISVVGEGIERILHFSAISGISLEIRVADDGGHGIVRIRCPQLFAIGISFRAILPCHCRISQPALALAPAVIEQEELIAHLVHLGELREIPLQTSEGLCGETEILQLVFFDDGSFEERFPDDGVRLCLLLRRKWYLCQIVFHLVRIVDGVVLLLLGSSAFCLRRLFLALLEPSFHLSFAHSRRKQGVGSGLSQCFQTIFCGIIVCFMGIVGQDGAVAASPVVLVFTISPVFPEGLLALIDQGDIVEIPLFRAVSACRRRVTIVSAAAVAAVVAHFSASGLSCGIALRLPLFFLALLQLLNDTVNGCLALTFADARQPLQRILKMNGRGGRHERIQHFRAPIDFVVIFKLLVYQPDSFRIATLCLVESALVPIDFSQSQQQHRRFECPLSGFLSSRLVGTDGRHGISLKQMDIANGVIHLVQIILVDIALRHSAQPLHH